MMAIPAMPMGGGGPFKLGSSLLSVILNVCVYMCTCVCVRVCVHMHVSVDLASAGCGKNRAIISVPLSARAAIVEILRWE